MPQVLPFLDEPVDQLEDGPRIPEGHRVGQLELRVTAGRTDQGLHDVLADRPVAEHRALVEERFRVARRALGLPGQHLRRAAGERDPLPLGHPLEQVGELRRADPAEVEPLAAPDDRGRHLVRLGGRQHEPHGRRRLFEQLQQRVERLSGEPLRLVQDVDLLPPHRRRRRRPLPQLPRVLDPAVRGGIDLDDVEVGALADPDALRADPAGLGRRAPLAVHHLGEDAGRRGLAGPPRAAEQERVRETLLAQRADQGADDVLLPDDLVGRLRAVLAVQGLVGSFLGHVRRAPRAQPRRTRDGPPGKTRSGGRAPAVDRMRLGRPPGRWLRPGNPAAPASARLPLLPSGSDGVRRLASRGTRPSSLRARGVPGPHGPRAGIRSRWSGLRVQGTASSPPSTATGASIRKGADAEADAGGGTGI